MIQHNTIEANLLQLRMLFMEFQIKLIRILMIRIILPFSDWFKIYMTS